MSLLPARNSPDCVNFVRATDYKSFETIAGEIIVRLEKRGEISQVTIIGQQLSKDTKN